MTTILRSQKCIGECNTFESKKSSQKNEYERELCEVSLHEIYFAVYFRHWIYIVLGNVEVEIEVEVEEEVEEKVEQEQEQDQDQEESGCDKHLIQ